MNQDIDYADFTGEHRNAVLYQRRRWPEKAASLIEKETSMEPKINLIMAIYAI